MFNGVIHVHFQNFTGALALPVHIECVAVETFTVAGITRHFNVGQKVHFNGPQALTFANGAATIARVERESRRRPAT